MRPDVDKPDPRVVRSRAAAVEAARALFLERGYAGTTMEDVAARAGLTKRTVYNNYHDKEALFRLVIADVLDFAEDFAKGLHVEFRKASANVDMEGALASLAQRLAQGILRPEVIAIRRMLIGDSRDFPEVGREYFQRAPRTVVKALASEFTELHRRRRLRVDDPKRAAEQFAYLIVGAPLDRAMLTGRVPGKAEILVNAREGVRTFLARYGC